MEDVTKRQWAFIGMNVPVFFLIAELVSKGLLDFGIVTLLGILVYLVGAGYLATTMPNTNRVVIGGSQ